MYVYTHHRDHYYIKINITTGPGGAGPGGLRRAPPASPGQGAALPGLEPQPRNRGDFVFIYFISLWFSMLIIVGYVFMCYFVGFLYVYLNISFNPGTVATWPEAHDS